MIIADRFKALIERMGDVITLVSGNAKAMPTVLSREDSFTYLTDAEYATSIRPVRALYVPFDNASATGDTVVWNAQSLSIINVADIRVQSSTIARILVCG